MVGFNDAGEKREISVQVHAKMNIIRTCMFIVLLHANEKMGTTQTREGQTFDI